MHDGDGAVIRNIVVHVNTQSVVSYVTQHVVALLYSVKTVDVDVVHVVDVVRLVGR